MTPHDQPAGPVGLRPETTVIRAGRPGHAAGGPLSTPVVLASNFHAGTTPAPGDEEDIRVYARTDATPTWEALEAAVGQVEGGHAVAFSSGMAAVAAVLDLVPAGGRIVAPTDCYFGVGELLADAQQQRRWAVDRVDLTDTAAVQAAITGADLLWLETPSNPLLDIADLPALCAAGRHAGVIVGVDNTFATPLLQQPLALGADVVVHSATKFIGGHSDLLSGIAIARDQAFAERVRHRRGLSGATPGALEAFLALRGLRTLALRLDRGQRNAGELARRLDQHPAVGRVRYPGLPGHPGHRTAAAQMTGFGAVLAFEVADGPTADRLCNAVDIITHATSLGGVETTIERRSKLPGQGHLPPGLLRLSVGCEHIDDLWNDLNSAIEQASRPEDPVFVPIDFAVPDGLTAGELRLEPLGPQHNAADYAAWTASTDHILNTPGFAGWGWPHEMSQEDNLRDLQRHADDFAERRGFTYTVLSTGTGDVIGCVYIYPPRADGPGGTEAGWHAAVRSWVRADHAALDPVLYHAVLAWLEREWPFHSIDYAPRA